MEGAISRTFTIATDDYLIGLIRSASVRLAVIAPALSTAVAEALAARMRDIPELSLTIILDADAEVYRMGYGDTKALEIIRKASSDALFELREQPGVRIGVVISDDRTMIYAPVSRNIEAGSATEEKPNAVMLEGNSTEKLAEASGAAHGETEIGIFGMEPERVAEMEADLKANPPRPFDLARRLTVFVTEVQFIELRVPNATFSSRKIRLPSNFQKVNDAELRRDIESSLKIPIDLQAMMEIKINSWRGDETLKVNEGFILRERNSIERAFFHDWKGRGKIILRKDKDQLQKELDRLVVIISAYHIALKSEIEESKSKFRAKLIREFRDLWQQSPPDHLSRRGHPTAKDCEADIAREADTMFERAVTLGVAEANVIYKDISIEDLKNKDLMESLHEVMEEAGVDAATLQKLFQIGDAAAAQGSFDLFR